MNEHPPYAMGRRHFLEHGVAAAIGLGILDVGADAAFGGAQPQEEDAPNVHNMLVVGDEAVFLSHLPMFQSLDKARSEFTSPHRYQVILEATFAKGDKTLSDLYLKDRRAHPDTRIYTLGPQEEFVLSRLFTPDAQPSLRSFTATVFRGHLEHQAPAIPGLEDARVNVTRVAHARRFDPRIAKPDRLEYIVFGKPGGLFLAHAIFGPPDFDHVLGAQLGSLELTAKDLMTDVRVVFDDRKNVSAERIHEGQAVGGTLRRATDRGAGGTKVQVKVGRQFYFEEGELLVPPTFDPTPEERKRLT